MNLGAAAQVFFTAVSILNKYLSFIWQLVFKSLHKLYKSKGMDIFFHTFYIEPLLIFT